MKRVILVVFLVVFQTMNFAQELKFGKVSKEELEETKHPLDPNAPAAILSKKYTVKYEYQQNIGFVQIREITMRIKIYTQEGFEYADYMAPFYNSKSARETVSKVNGTTYNLESGKITETKLKSDQVFENEVTKYRSELKFTMPNVKPGSVLEYKYEIRSPFEQNIDQVECQYEIPLNKLDVKISIPDYYTVKPSTKGYFPINLKQSKENTSFTLMSTERTNSGGTFNTVSSQTYADNYTYTSNVYSVTMSNVPAIKQEPYVDNLSNYKATINMEVVGYQFPGQLYKSYAQTWDDVVKSIYESENFGGELKKTGYFEQDLDKVISDIPIQTDRMAAVLEFCKSRIKWNDYYSFYSRDGVKDAYKKGVGNSGDINLNLINMLNYAGLIANPILVSTKSHGIPLFPTLEGFNYVVAGVELNGSFYLLDASDKFSIVNVLPERAINWSGRLIKKSGGYEEVSLFPSTASQENSIVSFSLKEDAKIIGKRRVQYTSYLAKNFREKYVNVSKESYLEKMESNYEGIDISNHEVTNDKELYQPVSETYDFEMANVADKIGNTIVFSPMFFLATSTNPFKSETREYPIDFVYPIKSRQTFTVTIPEGYAIESIPAPLNIAMPENLGSYRYTIQKTDTTVQLVVQYEINKAYISQDYYDFVKDFFKQIVDKEAEKVVLKKL
ncbi:DUF3857 domain-containing protein [Flavobacterium sp.]|uniref:DUF3857 domain-containing protein n=1 Tax=Flavobacterium sp. TaxID=239 RepID=UPI0025C5DCF5|nr:DUF3857 domain-containing protein [Flavobacterium sp.]MBA4153888.1 transglutaminase [Flavobacterium sp.]